MAPSYNEAVEIYLRHNLPTLHASVSVASCILALEARIAEVERERDEARDALDRIAEAVGAVHDQSMGPSQPGTPEEILAAVLDFDREHARLRAVAIDKICTTLLGPGAHTVDEVRAAAKAITARLACIEKAAGEAERVLLMEECSVGWLNDDDCISAGDDKPCNRCRALSALRLALAPDGERGEG